MYKHRRMRSAILQIFLIASPFCSGSIVTGQSPEIREPAPIPTPYYANPQVNVPSIRKFTFKHAKAADVLKILHQLAGKTDHIGLKIAVDERTNSLVFQPDDDRQTREFEETCALLDAESPPPSVTGPVASVSIPSLGPKPLAFDLSFPIVSDESIETHQNRYNELEQKAHQLADKLKQSTSLSESDRIDLQQAVRKSFEARQALQRAELADLAERMKSMQQSIDMREKLADKVIERRIEDLLNPNLKWDVTRTSTESTRAIAKEDLISPSKITSSQKMQAALQGTWTVRVFQADNQGDDRVSQVVIRGDLLLVHTIVNGKVLGVSPWKLVWPNAEMPYEIGAIWDPNTNTESEPFMPGRIAYDGKSFQLAFGEENPSAICPGENITYIDCVRDNIDDRQKATQAPSSISANKPGAADLSTPQATLDYLHRYSLAHPGGFPAECYTDEAILELSGMMLQNLSMMSAMSQIALQTGGVIGESQGVPVVSDTSPAFHLLVEALLNEQILPSPPGSADKAFKTLTTLTFASNSSNLTASAQVDRQLLRLAAGVLKSPREFLPAASKLLETFGETDADVTKSKKADQTQPKTSIAIIGNEATATLISSGDNTSPSPLSAPRITKLRRIDGRWLISEILSDEELSQLQSSYSSVMDQLGGAEEVKSDKSKTSESATQKIPKSSVESSKTEPPEWNDFLKVLPETGTALVMFSYEPEIKEQMLPVAKKVAEAASAQLIELPQTTWHKIIAPPATRFVLMKDRQLVGTRTGLMTEARLQDFVAKAKDWLTPRSTGIDENSLVRIDCYINPGTDNTGSQHGEALPITTAVVAVDEDQALLLGGKGIGEYIAKGYACVAIVRDSSGKQKQVPLDVLLTGPVKLAARGNVAKKSAATASISFGDGSSKEIAMPFLDSIYPKSFTETLEAYDVGSAIYRISGVHGLKPVKLAAVNAPPKVDQRVLSGSFTRGRQSPPLRGLRSPIHWQSQTVPKVGGHIYGGNINGAEMFEVLCPTRPAPCGFTFNEQGRLVGMHGLGEPSEKDMTHTVFMPDTTHSILLAALEKIDAPGLKAALAQTLEESKTAASIKDENRAAPVDAASANTSQPSTNPPAKFDTPQALLARVDECGKTGSYEEFIALFSDEGVRDLAGSMLMSAVMQTSIDELTQQMSGGLAEVNPDFVAFRKVLQRCPIEKLQGQWEFVSIEKPEGSSPFFDLQASSDQQPASVITISGTQLKLGDRVLAEISHPRLSNGVALLLDPDGKKLHCNGRYDFNTEYKISSSSKLEWMKLEFRELLDNPDATEKSKQVYEFRPLKTEAR